MIIYQRELSKKLFLLRLLFFFLIGVAMLAYQFQLLNLFYFLIVGLFMLTIVVPKNFIVTREFIEIKKYYFFGWIPFSWIFKKEIKFTIFPEISSFGMEGEYDVDSSGTELGCLLTIFGFFCQVKLLNRNFVLSKKRILTFSKRW